jgi:hypothetical protein
MTSNVNYIDIRAWTDDSEMKRDEDWQTFARLYPFASEWLQDVEASCNCESRKLVWTGGLTRLRHLGHVLDAPGLASLASLCGVSVLIGETGMRLDKPYRICPKCKAIAKAKGGE